MVKVTVWRKRRSRFGFERQHGDAKGTRWWSIWWGSPTVHRWWAAHVLITWNA